jgi:hypothetical protein
MSLELMFYFTGSDVPNQSKVIITSGSQSTSIMFKATYFASMSLKLDNNVMRGSDIMADNFGVSGSGKKKPISKGRRRYPTGMAFEGPE